MTLCDIYFYSPDCLIPRGCRAESALNCSFFLRRCKNWEIQGNTMWLIPLSAIATRSWSKMPNRTVDLSCAALNRKTMLARSLCNPLDVAASVMRVMMACCSSWLRRLRHGFLASECPDRVMLCRLRKLCLISRQTLVRSRVCTVAVYIIMCGCGHVYGLLMAIE